MLKLILQRLAADGAHRPGGLTRPVCRLRQRQVQEAAGRQRAWRICDRDADRRRLREVAREQGPERPILRTLREMARRHRDRRFRPLVPEERRCRLPAWPRAHQHRHPRLLGLCTDDSARPYHRRACGNSRGQGAGPHHLVPLRALHLDSRDRDGDLPDCLLRARAWLAADKIERRGARISSCCRC